MSKTNRGEIWAVDFEPATGAEIRKTRPAVVMNVPQVGRLALSIVVPITDWKDAFEGWVWFTYLASTPETGLSKASGADAFQVKSVSDHRMVRRLGQLHEPELSSISAAIALCVGYQPLKPN